MNKRVLLLAGSLAGLSAVIAAILLVRSRTVRGSGNVITRSRPVTPFQRVYVGTIQGEVKVAQSNPDSASAESVEVEADDNLIDRVTVEVKDGTLRIDSAPASRLEFIRPSKPIQVRITARTVDKLTLGGQGRIAAAALKVENLELAISGTGEIKAGPLDVQALAANINGVGRCAVAGQAVEQTVNLSGVGAYDAAGLESRAVCLVISGIGKAAVLARESLDVSISGTGNVTYHGHPKVTRKVTGPGKVIAAPESAPSAVPVTRAG